MNQLKVIISGLIVILSVIQLCGLLHILKK